MSGDDGQTRRSFLRTSAAGLGGAVLLGGGTFALTRAGDGDAGQRRPPIVKPDEPLNLVWVCLDTLRADHVGAYARDDVRPSRAVRTPGIDAFAREALRFRHARPEALPTGPTRRSVYTGIRTFPMDNWKRDPDSPAIYGWQRIPRSQTMISDVLRRRGYRTAMVCDNTWMLKPSWKRFRDSWDDFRGLPGQEYQRVRGGRRSRQIDMSDYLPRGLRRKPDERVDTYAGVVERYLKNAGERRREEDWWSPRVFTGAMAWLDEHVRQRPTEPFSLFVESYDPHEPWDPPKKYVDLYDDPDYRGVEPISPLYGRDDYLSARERRRMRSLYAGEVTMADRWFGELVGHLDRLKLLDRTVVILYSDHGHSISDRGFVGKSPSQVYSEMVDVPLLIRHPEGRKAGKTTNYLAQLHDIMPTALAMLGIPAPGASEGHDLSPLFRDAELQDREVQTAGYNDYVWAGDERWSYIDSNRFKNPKLYDRRADPRERRDVSGQEEDVVNRFRRAIRRDAGNKPIPRY
jgi:arylsulfatase A-like enzyme